MFEFKQFTIQDRAVFLEYLSINNYTNSEYNFNTLYAWQDSYNLKYAIIEDCLCITGSHKGRPYAYFPIGEKENVARALDALGGWFKALGSPFVIISLSRKMIETIEEIGLNFAYTLEPKRSFFDYIYMRESLVTLSGKKLHGQRNHFNYFEKNYTYDFAAITPENETECLEKLKSFIFGRSEDSAEEFAATKKLMLNRDELGLVGRCLIIDGSIAGVILGEEHAGKALIQIAKADIAYRGASVALFKLFLEENFTECEKVNFMEDLGLEGLRKFKLSYNPVYLHEKFTLSEG